jgi:hypothetical protein
LQADLTEMSHCPTADSDYQLPTAPRKSAFGNRQLAI